MLNIIGSRGAEMLQGGTGSDLVVGLGGNDSLIGREGDDALFGGGGNDFLAGDIAPPPGGPYDIGFGPVPGSSDLPPGNNLIFAGAGNDAITAGFGADTVYGGAGDDYIVGYGAAYRYSDQTPDGNNRLYGGAGNDTILGGVGNDWMCGGAGQDSLEGNVGVDTLTGGAGADHFSFGRFNVYWGALDGGVGPGNRDVIGDFHHNQHDVLDVSGYRTGFVPEGTEGPLFVGPAAFRPSTEVDNMRVQVRYEIEGDNTIVQIYSPFNKAPPGVPQEPYAMVEIELRHVQGISADDLFLS
jgi:Ca2+-binding RTX toxin-like protein